MKKTFLIALAGLMLFAFTQCGKNDPKSQIEKLTSKVTKAKTCEDLAKLDKEADEVAKKVNDLKDLKDEDKKAIEEATLKLAGEYLKKYGELKCDEAAGK